MNRLLRLLRLTWLNRIGGPGDSDGAAAVPDHLLLESGDALLLESGDYILLEAD